MKAFVLALPAVLLTCVALAQGAEDAPLDPKELMEANKQGIDLYDEGRYEEALPHLRLAAQNGFKRSQARLGGLYLYGLGVERSDLRGLAWLGTAARDSEDADINALFESVWVKVPEQTAPKVTAVIDQYVEKYGMDPTEHCLKTRQAGSHISKATCVFDDKYHTLLELDQEAANQATLGTRRPGADVFGQ